MRRKSKNYYAVVVKNTSKVGVFVEKSQVCDYINTSLYKFNKYFEGGKWETDDFIVTFVDEIMLKSCRGDKTGLNLGEYRRN